MNDKELLEQAAKAAGLPYIKPAEGYDGRLGILIGENRMNTQVWNPLTDDGDALRLAVKLRLTVEQWFFGQEALVYDFKESTMYEGLGVSVHEPYGTDPYAATRRAIVRAAAEIGRNMK